MHLDFILGGARSGKSKFAEQLALKRGGVDGVWFVATLRDTTDAEMQRRILRHRAGRPASWPTTVLDDAWRTQLSAPPRARVAVLDCLSLFISGVLFMIEPSPVDADAEDAAESLTLELLAAMTRTRIDWIVVTNEVGMGVVPEHAGARAFRDALGRANQTMMQAATEAWLLVAGVPLKVR